MEYFRRFQHCASTNAGFRRFQLFAASFRREADSEDRYQPNRRVVEHKGLLHCCRFRRRYLLSFKAVPVTTVAALRSHDRKGVVVSDNLNRFAIFTSSRRGTLPAWLPIRSYTYHVSFFHTRDHRLDGRPWFPYLPRPFQAQVCPRAPLFLENPRREPAAPEPNGWLNRMTESLP